MLFVENAILYLNIIGVGGLELQVEILAQDGVFLAAPTVGRTEDYGCVRDIST